MTLKQIQAIDPSNRFINYIIDRLQSDNYRGWHVSQHNRYGLFEIQEIIQCIHDKVGVNSFAIPTGDPGKNVPLGSPHRDFQDILTNVVLKIGKGTTNTIKKNFFPDMGVMGLLKRDKVGRGWGKNGNLTPKAITLMELKSNPRKARKMFMRCLEQLFGARLPQLLQMLYFSKYCNDRIDVYELMFILSDSDEKIDKIDLLNEYRRLDKNQKATAMMLIKGYANSNSFKGNKIKKRDFGNWKNEAVQIIHLMKGIAYLEVEKDNKWFRMRLSCLTRMKYLFKWLMCKFAQFFNKKKR